MTVEHGDGWTPPDGPEVRPAFQGLLRGMAPVVLRGLFLTFVTLGVYRFWYVTDVRRYLWTHVEVDGDGLEYTGRGLELFIGFLVALAVVVPLTVLVFFAGLLAGVWGQVAAQVVSTLIVIVLAQYAMFRARRYRLTRTIWRGIRFQQSGSGWAYAARSISWGLLALLTLGLAYPFMRASLERYKMTNTWYGDQKGAFTATGFGLFRRGVLLWMIAMALIVAPGVLAVEAVESSIESGAPSVWHGVAVFGLVFAAAMLPLLQAIEFRWWANGCSLGPATARCDLGLFAFLRTYLAYLGVLVLFAIVAGAAVGAVALGFSSAGVFESGELTPGTIAFTATFVLIYLLGGLVLAALWQLFAARRIWQ
jgi:uncharacterized membrane protein YjgN (DUF898 family)